MAITINLYKFQKKGPKSTKRPTGAGTAINGEIKEPSSIMEPVIMFSAAVFSDPTDYNYAYIQAFKRYYFISNVVWQTGRWEVSFTCDKLATYKTEIGATPMYMLRAAAAMDGAISDNYYPPTANCIVSKQLQDLDTVPLADFNSGFYLVSVLGASTNAGGAEFLYQLTPANFKAMIRTLYTDIYNWGITDIIDKLAQSFGGNPQQLISDVIWVPYAFPGVATNNMIFGGYTLAGINAEVVTDTVMDLATFRYNVPKHPKAATKGKYLNCSPYSDYMLNINCGGIISLDSTKLVDVTYLEVQRTLDVKGNLVTTVLGSNNYDFAKVSGQMGVRISLSGSNPGGTLLSDIVTTGANIGAAIATGNIGGAVGAVGSGIGSIAGAMSGSSSNTSSGSSADIGDPGRLIATFYDIPGEDNTEYGRPLCQVRTPAALGGYCLPKEVHVEIPGTAEEQAEIVRLCEGGFIYE